MDRGDSLLLRTIREKWIVTPAAARSALNRVQALLEDPRTKPRDVLRLTRGLMELEQIIIRAALADATIAEGNAMVRAQQQQIRDLQNAANDQPIESQPLRIAVVVADDCSPERSGSPAVAPPTAGGDVDQEHSLNERTA